MKQTIIKILKKSIPDIEAIYIFGSVAEGRDGSSSDVDIAFLSPTPIESLKVWELSNEIAFELKRDVDLVELKQTNTIFRFQIISKGDRIYCNNEKEIEAYESLVWSFYVRFKDERRAIDEQILKDGRVY